MRSNKNTERLVKSLKVWYTMSEMKVKLNIQVEEWFPYYELNHDPKLNEYGYSVEVPVDWASKFERVQKEFKEMQEALAVVVTANLHKQ